MANGKICEIIGCGKPLVARGLCNSHWIRWRKYGDPLAGGPKWGEASEYYLSTVLVYEGDECLIWPHARNKGGYGTVNFDGKKFLVSRKLCEDANGPAPSHFHEAAHSCGKGQDGCVTKRHLSWKTHADNMKDMVNHGRSPKGEKQGRVKLTEADVIEIRLLLKSVRPKEIAKLKCVSTATITSIGRSENWGWLRG